jgi:hypothetical protein
MEEKSPSNLTDYNQWFIFFDLLSLKPPVRLF